MTDYQTIFSNIFEAFIGYLPKMFGGVILLFIGWLLAWFVKRLVIQLFKVFKLEYILVRLSWGKVFSNADIRQSFYNLIGNITFFIILLIFFYFALITWDLQPLTVISKDAILFFPKLLFSLAIFGFGLLITAMSTKALLRALINEGVPHASFITYFARINMLIFFFAMALAELDLVSNIVTIGFTIVFATMGLIALILTVLYGRDLFNHHDDSQKEKKK